MSKPPAVSADDLAATPATVLALVQWLTTRVSALEAEVADLKARLNKDSTNSSVPPSATHPHAELADHRPDLLLHDLSDLPAVLTAWGLA